MKKFIVSTPYGFHRLHTVTADAFYVSPNSALVFLAGNPPNTLALFSHGNWEAVWEDGSVTPLDPPEPPA